jgi:segregation and condensation protein B
LSRKSTRKPVDESLVAAVEAVVFASGEPVDPREIASAFDQVDLAEVEQAIDALDARYEKQPRGLRLERVAGGIRLATRPELGEWVRRFFRQRNRARLSPAALETLAIVAYRQPVTAPEIQAIRGKDPGAALKGLVDKRMIRILGKKKVIGTPLLYGSSKQFLVHFGLNNLEDLPSIEDFDELIGGMETDAASLLQDQIDQLERPNQSDVEAPAAIDSEAEVEPAGAAVAGDDPVRDGAD